MARQGLSQEQVFKAAQALLDEGQSITVANIREKLGSGSYSTINTHLAKWREANDNQKPANIPEMPSSVDNALRHVWALAWKETQTLIQSERDGLDAARREYESGKKELEAEIARLEAENDAQRVELDRAGDTLAKTEKALSEAEISKQKLKEDNIRLDERLNSAETMTATLKEEIGKLHERLKEATVKPKTPPTKK